MVWYAHNQSRTTTEVVDDVESHFKIGKCDLHQSFGLSDFPWTLGHNTQQFIPIIAS